MPIATPVRKSSDRSTPPGNSATTGTAGADKPGALTKIKKTPNSKIAASTASSTRSSPAPDSMSKPIHEDKDKAATTNGTSAPTNSQQSSNATPTMMKKKNSKKSERMDVDEPAGKKLCKHCKEYVDIADHQTHSPACSRAKKARRKVKETAEASAGDATSSINGATGNGTDMKDEDEGDSKEKDAAGVTAVTPVSTAKNGKKSVSSAILEGGSVKKTNSKKRKATEDAGVSTPDGKGEGTSKPPTKKQKKKEEAAAKAKAPKPKGPVDVEKQCGVILPNGAMCARSLTCKSHAMGAKRNVPGRSAPYDVLLAQYQKKNQAKLQKAALAATQPLPDDVVDNQAGPVDSDEEREAVMSAISRANARPLYERPVLSVQQRHQHIRMKDALHNALRGASGAGIFAIKPRDNSTLNATPQPPTPTIANSKTPATPTTGSSAATATNSNVTGTTAATTQYGQQKDQWLGKARMETAKSTAVA